MKVGERWTGYTVMAVPESGLFVKHGELHTGDGDPLAALGELQLFSRMIDAERLQLNLIGKWPGWKFPIIAVRVKERE